MWRMFTDAQVLYLEEVLGLEAKRLRSSASILAPHSPPPVCGLLVVTPSLAAVERELLDKILKSVQMSAGEFVHLQIQDGEVLPEASEVLLFGDLNFGTGSSLKPPKIWRLPALDRMIGDGAEVAGFKRQAWSVLQTFRKGKG